jgi:translation initiation factor IF-2
MGPLSRLARGLPGAWRGISNAAAPSRTDVAIVGAEGPAGAGGGNRARLAAPRHAARSCRPPQSSGRAAPSCRARAADPPRNSPPRRPRRRGRPQRACGGTAAGAPGPAGARGRPRPAGRAGRQKCAERRRGSGVRPGGRAPAAAASPGSARPRGPAGAARRGRRPGLGRPGPARPCLMRRPGPQPRGAAPRERPSAEFELLQTPQVQLFEEKPVVGGACRTEHPFPKVPGLGHSSGAGRGRAPPRRGPARAAAAGG